MPTKKLEDGACKDIIRDMGKRLVIDPKLITTRLMSDEDKEDMRNGLLPIHVLELHVKVWIKSGLPNYREGKTIPLAQEELEEHAKQQEK